MADISPSEQQFRDDLGKPDFLAGECRGIWRVDMDARCWPEVIMIVKSDSGREYTVCFQCEGYPAIPTAHLWDAEKNCVLRLDATNCSKKMRMLLSQQPQAFYLPCDRQWHRHNDWHIKYPDRQWDKMRGIVSYLEQLCDELD